MPSVKRSYRSPVREAQAEATRHTILDAAAQLFLSRGFAATTVREIARGAGVADQTVYNAYGDKAGVLWAVSMRIVAGAEDNTDPTATPLLEQLAGEDDPVARVRLVAKASRETWEGGMLRFESIFFGPEVIDPRLLELRTAGWEHKRANTTAAVRMLFPDDLRPPGITTEEIVDVAMAVDSAAAVRVLIEQCGWTYDRFEAWLADFMLTQFLRLPDDG